MSELHAQELTRDMGFKTTTASYPQELRVAFLLNKVVDDVVVVRDAFLTGNFTEVRNRVNEKLKSAHPDGMSDAVLIPVPGLQIPYST